MRSRGCLLTVSYTHIEETAKAETNPKKQAELMEIAEVCRRVPEFPARNFREALQSFWFTHCCIQIEQCGCGHSLGRYGQYMYPFYKKDLDEGMLTKEQVLTLLKCCLLYTSSGHAIMQRRAKAPRSG